MRGVFNTQFKGVELCFLLNHNSTFCPKANTNTPMTACKYYFSILSLPSVHISTNGFNQSFFVSEDQTMI